MLLVVLMLWACATFKAQQVFQKPVILLKWYTTSDCTGDAYRTNAQISYSGSATCTGTATCTR